MIRTRNVRLGSMLLLLACSAFGLPAGVKAPVRPAPETGEPVQKVLQSLEAPKGAGR